MTDRSLLLRRCRLFSGGASTPLFAVERARLDHAGRTHDVENAGDKPKQQEDDQSPRRRSEPAVGEPAEDKTDDDAPDQLGRQPHAAGEPRHVGGRAGRGAGFNGPARTNLVEPFAETPKPRGESGLFGRSGAPFVVARAVAHVSTPATKAFPPPQKRADHTEAVPTLSRIGHFVSSGWDEWEIRRER